MTEQFPRATPPTSLTPLPKHPPMPSPPAETSRRIGDVKKDIDGTLPRGLLDKPTPKIPAPQDEGIIDMGEDPEIAQPKTRRRGGIDPDGINPNTAFGSDEQELWDAIQESGRLPIVPNTPESSPSPEPAPTQRQRPTGRPKRRPRTDRLSSRTPSRLELILKWLGLG